MSRTDIGQISVCSSLRITERGKTNDTREDDKWKSSKIVWGDKIIYSFNKCLLSPYYVAGTMDTKLKKV